MGNRLVVVGREAVLAEEGGAETGLGGNGVGHTNGEH